MLTIYGKATSINVRKVLWTCAEIELPFERIDYGSGTDNPLNTAAFLALNPHGLIPVIQDEFGVLSESNTICRYLATRYQREDLLPNSPMARAQIEKWMDWQATELNNAWRYVFMAKVRHHANYQDAQQIAASSSEWNRLMTILDQQLEKTGAYIAGERFSLADIGIGLSINRWRSTPMERPRLGEIDRYFDLLSQRSGFRAFGANGTP